MSRLADLRIDKVKNQHMVQASCHCGLVQIEVTQAPDVVNECTCSICGRYGTLWAYYSPQLVRITPPGNAGTDVYRWGERKLEFHRCKGCGCITHWSPVDKSRDRMGVNARLMKPEVIRQTRRLLDGS
jgi:hypothetical protein